MTVLCLQKMNNYKQNSTMFALREDDEEKNAKVADFGCTHSLLGTHISS